VFKKIALLALIAGVLIGAQAPVPDPEKPQPGQKVSWKIKGFAYESENPRMLLAAYTPDTVLVQIIPGRPSQDEWYFSYTVPREATILTYKIEDDEKPLLDDDGVFFATPVYEESGKPRYDANRSYATLYLDPLADRWDRACELVKLELEYYPMNWQALVLLHRLELQVGETTEAAVAAELDSLLAAEPDSLEALRFAAMEFFIVSQGFKNKGEALMALCAENYPEGSSWTDYQNSIYAFISETPQRLGEFERAVFPLLKGIAADFLAEFPTSPLAPAFIITMLQVKHEQPTALWAAEMIEWLEKYPDDPELNIQLAEYYMDRSWKTALGYYRSAVKNTDDPMAAARFAEAAAVKGKNFAEASKYLKQTIKEISADRYRELLWWRSFSERRTILLETQATLYTTLGWLSFKYGKYEDAVRELLLADSLLTSIPDYEEEVYRRLLAVSEKAGDLAARKIALLNLLLVEPEDRTIQKALQDIYLLDHGTVEGFEEWLQAEELEIALRRRMNVPVPNFPLLTLAGDTVYASEFAGKVVVVNFWATWCGPCKEEIPRLNQLVRSYQDRDDVVFIGISSEEPQTVDSFLDANTFLYEAYIDPSGMLSSLFQVSAVPAHTVIDPRGVLQFHHVGAIPNIDKLLTMEINSLLNE
jgi:thiol-disulfide isomerase/thioredoxin